MSDLQAGAVGQLSSEAIATMATRAIKGAPVAQYAEQDPLPWAAIDDGGWDLIGVAEADGGGDATLRDLVQVALAWGQTCIAQPLLETIWAKRWDAAAREDSGPVTISVHRPNRSDGSGVAPFGSLPDIRVLRGVATGGSTEPASMDHRRDTPDDLAPSLRSVVLPWSSDVGADAARELGVLWAAEAAGGARRLLSTSIEYAKTREQFTKPIGSFQAIKHRLANMHIDTEHAETAVIWASLEDGTAHRAAKHALALSIRVAESSIQVHGGMGFTWEMGLHYYLRSMLARRELLVGLWG